MIPGVLTSTSDNALETRNLALNSTFVTQGTCTGITFATGDRTVMGRLVAMSGEKKFKLTTIQKEVWFFTKIISCFALFFFLFSLLLYGVWLRTSYPGFDTNSSAISNSIGCLTAFVPQVQLSFIYLSLFLSDPSLLGFAHLCRSFVDRYRSPYGKALCVGQKFGYYRDPWLHVRPVLRQDGYTHGGKDGKPSWSGSFVFFLYPNHTL